MAVGKICIWGIKEIFADFCLVIIAMVRKKNENEKSLKREEIRLLLHYEWLQSTSAVNAANKVNYSYGSNIVTEWTAYRWYFWERRKSLERQGAYLTSARNWSRSSDQRNSRKCNYIDAHACWWFWMQPDGDRRDFAKSW